MIDDAEDDVMPAPVRGLLELFETELKAVKFPNLDADVLTAAVVELKARGEQVARAEEALASARRGMHEAQEVLAQKASRALAYARVFAEEDPELLERLDAIGNVRSNRRMPRSEAEPAGPADPSTPRRRGRPPKAKSSESLFVDEGAVLMNGVVDRPRTIEA